MPHTSFGREFIEVLDQQIHRNERLQTHHMRSIISIHMQCQGPEKERLSKGFETVLEIETSQPIRFETTGPIIESNRNRYGHTFG
jgi:hypothetical protein